MIVTSPTIEKIAPALAQSQALMGAAAKDAKNPHFNSRYADLASVWSAFRDAFATHSLAVIQSPAIDGNHVRMVTRILHASGEWIEGSIEATAKDASPQSIGSCVTYLRRYGASALIGIVSDDDDGQAAQSSQPERQRQAQRAPITDRHTKAAPAAAASTAAKQASSASGNQPTATSAPVSTNAAPAAGMDPKAESTAIFQRTKKAIGDNWSAAVWKHTSSAWQLRLDTLREITDAVEEIRRVVGDSQADAMVDNAFGNVDLTPESVQGVRSYLVKASLGEVAKAENQQAHAAVVDDESPPF